MSKDLAMQENEKELNNTQWDIHEVQEMKPLEFTDDLKPELYGLEVSEVNGMVGGIDVIKHELEVLKNAYIDVIKLEITPENLPTFKDLRKNFTKNRTSAEKLRKAKKSYFLNGGRFVDAIFKKIDAERELMESKLLEAEKFFENQEKEKAHLLNLERIEKIRPYVQDADNMSFLEFDDESFDDFVLGKKTRFENEQKEREAREMLEADLKAKQDAELKSEQESKKEAEKLAKAPIKRQLYVWVDSFNYGLQPLENETTKDVILKFEAFKKWAKSEIEKL